MRKVDWHKSVHKPIKVTVNENMAAAALLQIRFAMKISATNILKMMFIIHASLRMATGVGGGGGNSKVPCNSDTYKDTFTQHILDRDTKVNPDLVKADSLPVL